MKGICILLLWVGSMGLMAPKARSGGEDPHQALVSELAASLAKADHPLDLTKLKIEVKQPQEMDSDLRKQDELFFPPSYFEGMARFFTALGAPGVSSGAVLEEASVRAEEAHYSAYYQPGEGRLVFKAAGKGDLESLGPVQRYLVAHEMVHAYQDQVVGIANLLKKGPQTQEHARTVSCMLEGEAEAVALSLRQDLKTVKDEDLSSDVERVLGGEMSVVYSAGRLFMVHRYQEGGWKAVAKWRNDPPPSTEQILHPQKLGQDVPTEVALPRFDDPLVHGDTLGELEVRVVLHMLGVPHRVAWLAAAGWDGDRLGVYAPKDKGTLVVWRTLWDREKDAEQFEAALTGHCPAGASVVRTGRCVDFCAATDPATQAAAVAALRAQPGDLPVVTADALSTAAEEAAYLATNKSPAAKGKLWSFPKSGLQVPIPQGWSVVEYNGVKVLADRKEAAKSGFAPNINVMNVPAPAGMGIDQLLKVNQAQLLQLGASLDFVKKTTIGGVPAIYYAFAMATGPNKATSHCVGTILLRNGRMIVVTATTLQDQWKAREAMLKSCLKGITFAASEGK